MDELLLFNKFFPIVDICLRCEDIARQSCVMVDGAQMAIFTLFLRPINTGRKNYAKIAIYAPSHNFARLYLRN